MYRVNPRVSPRFGPKAIGVGPVAREVATSSICLQAPGAGASAMDNCPGDLHPTSATASDITKRRRLNKLFTTIDYLTSRGAIERPSETAADG